jgi:hypothetical protein
MIDYLHLLISLPDSLIYIDRHDRYMSQPPCRFAFPISIEDPLFFKEVILGAGMHDHHCDNQQKQGSGGQDGA